MAYVTLQGVLAERLFHKGIIALSPQNRCPDPLRSLVRGLYHSDHFIA